jgi:peptidoglycan hydrolase-like protein with peptidoglycan-binding domain
MKYKTKNSLLALSLFALLSSAASTTFSAGVSVSSNYNSPTYGVYNVYNSYTAKVGNTNQTITVGATTTVAAPVNTINVGTTVNIPTNVYYTNNQNISTTIINSVNSSKYIALERGDRGLAVVDLQKALNYYAGSKLNLKGNFGPQTELAVKRFQAMYNLPVTGKVQAGTINCLSMLDSGMTKMKSHKLLTNKAINIKKNVGTRYSNIYTKKTANFVSKANFVPYPIKDVDLTSIYPTKVVPTTNFVPSGATVTATNVKMNKIYTFPIPKLNIFQSLKDLFLNVYRK